MRRDAPLGGGEHFQRAVEAAHRVAVAGRQRQHAGLALGGARARVQSHVNPLLVGREARSFARVEAHRHHIELLADVERHNFQGGQQAIQHLCAKHRALVVNHRQNHGFVAEVFAQAHGLAGLIMKSQVERHLIVQPLIDTHVGKQ